MLSPEDLYVATAVCQSWRSALLGDRTLWHTLHIDVHMPEAVGKARSWARRSGRSLRVLSLAMGDQMIPNPEEDGSGADETSSASSSDAADLEPEILNHLGAQRVLAIIRTIARYDGGERLDSVYLQAESSTSFESHYAPIALLASLALVGSAFRLRQVHIVTTFPMAIEVSSRFFGFLCRLEAFTLRRLAPVGRSVHGKRSELLGLRDHERADLQKISVLGEQQAVQDGPIDLPPCSDLTDLTFQQAIFISPMSMPSFSVLDTLTFDHCRIGLELYRMLELAPHLRSLTIKALQRDEEDLIALDEMWDAYEFETITLRRLEYLHIGGQGTPCLWSPEPDDWSREPVLRPEILMPRLVAVYLIDLEDLDREEDEDFRMVMAASKKRRTRGGSDDRSWRYDNRFAEMDEEAYALEMEDEMDELDDSMPADPLFRLLEPCVATLRKLSLDGSCISETTLMEIAREARHLDELSVRATMIRGEALAPLAEWLRCLETLDVRECPRVCMSDVATASTASLRRSGARLHRILVSDPGPVVWGDAHMSNEFEYFERIAYQWLSHRGVLADWEEEARTRAHKRRYGKRRWTQPVLDPSRGWRPGLRIPSYNQYEMRALA